MAYVRFRLQIYRHLKSGDIDWPSTSPELIPVDFFLCSHLKSKVYVSNPWSINKLKENWNIRFTTRNVEKMIGKVVNRGDFSVAKKKKRPLVPLISLK